jgi:hypothetical protein
MIEVVDRGVRLAFSLDDVMRYHGPHSPGGVAVAFQALVLALPVVGPDRRTITVRTAFGGPGARDAFEVVLRAVTGDRYVVDPSLARPELGRARERFVFVLRSGDRTATLVLRDGFVSDEFIDLARAPSRSDVEEARLDALKVELADRVMAVPASEVLALE